MTMPLTLTLIRHGESESNAAKAAAYRGVKIPREKELMTVHTSERRLTLLGEEQARRAGSWLSDWFESERVSRNPKSLRCYFSPYVRAAETAGLMGLEVKWRPETRLMERNWGELDQVTHAERDARFREKIAQRKEFAFFWRPSDGETLQDVFMRIRDLIDTLHRECEDMHVIVVSHGETMWVWRYILEYWMPQDLRKAMLSDDGRFDLMNCRIIQYSRMNGTGIHDKHYSKVRFVNPMNPEDPKTNQHWKEVSRQLWGDEQLLQYARAHERFLEPA